MQVRHLKRGFFGLVRQNVDLVRSRVLFQCKSKTEAIRASRWWWWRLRVAVVTWMHGKPIVVWEMNNFADAEKEERRVDRRERRKVARARRRAQVQA